MKSSNVTNTQSQTLCILSITSFFSVPLMRACLTCAPHSILFPSTTASEDLLLGEPLCHSLTLLKMVVYNITSAFDGQGIRLHFQANSKNSEPGLGISYHSRAVTERQPATWQAPIFSCCLLEDALFFYGHYNQ